MKSGKSIYIVDDDEDDRTMIREALEEIVDKVHVQELRSGHDLINLLDSKAADLLPKLILMDMNMPSMNGLEALSKIRSRAERSHIPVIMFSTSSNQQLINSAYQQGINAYLTKPDSYLDYTLIAEAINVCFLNNGPSPLATKSHIRSFVHQSVLVIEDSADHWDLMQRTLNQIMPQANLIYINNTKSTLDFLESGWLTMAAPLKLIILDLYMPTCQNGLDLLDQIKRFLTDNHLSYVPIIIFSASDHSDDITNCYQHQANIYMVKPLNMSETIAHFRNLNHFIWNGSKGPRKN